MQTLTTLKVRQLVSICPDNRLGEFGEHWEADAVARLLPYLNSFRYKLSKLTLTDERGFLLEDPRSFSFYWGNFDAKNQFVFVFVLCWSLLAAVIVQGQRSHQSLVR